jgi:hypothetical protein
MRGFIPISTLAVALASGAAFAGGNDHERHGGTSAQFESLDRNSDQKLSQTEAAADQNVSSKFAALDVDGDGYITKREYSASMKKDQQDDMNQPQRQPMPPDEPRNPY